MLRGIMARTKNAQKSPPKPTKAAATPIVDKRKSVGEQPGSDSIQVRRRPPPLPKGFLELLKEKGFTPNSLSKQIGSEDLLRKFAWRKERVMRTPTLGRLSEVLETPIAELARLLELKDASKIELPNNTDALPVRFFVQAGTWREEDDSVQDQRYGPPASIDPQYPSPQWIEEIIGDSVNQIAPEGSFAHVVDWPALGRDPKERDLVVVQRTRDQGAVRERTIKEVRFNRTKVELWPRSTNPRWSEPLVLSDYGEDADVTVSIAGLVIWIHRPTHT